MSKEEGRQKTEMSSVEWEAEEVGSRRWKQSSPTSSIQHPESSILFSRITARVERTQRGVGTTDEHRCGGAGDDALRECRKGAR